MRAEFRWGIVGGIVIAAGAANGWLLNSAAVLRADIVRERLTSGTFASRRAEHERLISAQPAGTEIERIASQIETLPQARAELAMLRQHVEAAEGANAENKGAPAQRFAIGSTVVAAEWTNAGTATPQATLETALWAGAGGDVDTLARTFVLIDNRTRGAAKTWWESLSEPMRAQYGSAERLLAFLTVRDMPLGSAEARDFGQLRGWPAPAAQMMLLLRDANGKAKDANLLFMNPGDGWKLVVTEAVVAKYAAMLKEPDPAARP